MRNVNILTPFLTIIVKEFLRFIRIWGQTVVPPAVTLRILEEAKSLGHTKVWVQPGAEDDTVLEYLHEHGFHHVAGGPCIMVESRRH